MESSHPSTSGFGSVAYSAADSPSPLGAHQRPDTGAQGDAAVDRSIESSPFMKLHGNNISH
jgi:hypothetical protein